MRHGRRRYETTGVLPPDLRQSIDEFRDGLISDQGGLENLTTMQAGLVRLLVRVETLTRIDMNDVISAGSGSSRFKQAHDRLLAAADRWLRVGAVLGVDRRQRPVLDPLDYIAGRDA